MTLFALNELWNEIYTAGGFWVGVVGLVVGVAGFWIAIVQIRETQRTAEAGKKAAEAAEEAANRTLAESKDAYERFVGTFASRLLSELEGAVGAKNWSLARFRCNDLAELVASLPAAQNATAREEVVFALRDLAQEFATVEAKAAAKMPKPIANKWTAALLVTHAVLDYLRKPFREVNNGPVTDSHAGPTAQSVGTGTPDQNTGAAGQLDPGAQPE